MPDAAVGATELQFQRLLAAASPDRPIDLQLFAFDEVERAPAIKARMAKRYRGAEALPDAGLDALIVTGAEPRTADLRDEPYWSSFARMTDWAAASGTPVLWSCLAAHAAVLHLDGIARRRLDEKCSGVFDCRKTDTHPLTTGLPNTWPTPHSRINTLDEAALRAAGYTMLSVAPDAGVDAFVGTNGEAEFTFLQGHPEYDANSLAAEYSRDILRYAQGLRPAPPQVPEHYFDPDTADRLQAIAHEAPAPEIMKTRMLEALRGAHPADRWRGAWGHFYAAWLGRAKVAARAD